MDRILTSGEIIDFMESRSIGPISGSAELFLLCQIAYELKIAREEREYLNGLTARNEVIGNRSISPAFVTGLTLAGQSDLTDHPSTIPANALPAHHLESIAEKPNGKARRK